MFEQIQTMIRDVFIQYSAFMYYIYMSILYACMPI